MFKKLNIISYQRGKDIFYIQIFNKDVISGEIKFYKENYFDEDTQTMLIDHYGIIINDEKIPLRDKTPKNKEPYALVYKGLRNNAYSDLVIGLVVE